MTAERLCIIGRMPWWFIGPLSALIIIAAVFYEKKMKPVGSRSLKVPLIGTAIIIGMLMVGYITTEYGTSGQMYSKVFADFIPAPGTSEAQGQKSEADRIISVLTKEGYQADWDSPNDAYAQLCQRYPDLTMYQADVIITALRDAGSRSKEDK